MPKTIRSPQHKLLRELLIATRQKAGLTQTTLAQRLGRPQSYVAKYENGERRLDVIEFVEIAHAVDAEPRKLFARFLTAAQRV